MDLALRVAAERDIPALAALIPLSVRALQAAYYSAAQMDAAIGPIFGVDRDLIRDGTYFIIEDDGMIAAAGGWSKRRSLFGSDAGRADGASALLDPRRDAARIRAFYVHPDWARRGLGRRLLAECEGSIAQAGFRSIELVATLAGEPLYATAGYVGTDRYDIPLAGGLGLPAVRMVKTL